MTKPRPASSACRTEYLPARVSTIAETDEGAGADDEGDGDDGGDNDIDIDILVLSTQFILSLPDSSTDYGAKG